MKFNQLGPVGAEVSGVNLKGLTGSQIKHVKKAFLRAPLDCCKLEKTLS